MYELHLIEELYILKNFIYMMIITKCSQVGGENEVSELFSLQQKKKSLIFKKNFFF